VKSLVAFAALAAAAAVAAPASAQNLPSFAPISYNASLGYTGFSLPRADFGAVTLRAGADFGKYLGLEGEGSFGVTDTRDFWGQTDIKAHLNNQYAGYVVARAPVLANANLFARGGYGHSEIKATERDIYSGVTTSANIGSDSWNYGAGGEYFFDAKNGLRAEYTKFNFVKSGATDADTWTISYVRKF
jgi:hypothetical protein